jgi:hypothetical protein
MHGGWQLFSPTLQVEVEGSILMRWVALYAHADVWRRGGIRPKASQVRGLLLSFIFCYESMSNTFS